MSQNVTLQHDVPIAAMAGLFPVLAIVLYCLNWDMKRFLVFVLLLGWARRSANSLVMRLDSFSLTFSMLLTSDLLLSQENAISV